MLRIIIFISIVGTYATEGWSQPTFNRIYRLDSAQKLATVFSSLRIKDNDIFLAGRGNVRYDSTRFITVGIFARLDRQGNIIKSKDYWTGTSANYFFDDVLLLDKDSINLVGGNHEPYVTFLRTDINGNEAFIKKYYPDSFPSHYYGNPSALVKYKSGFAFATTIGRSNNRPAMAGLLITDYNGNTTKTINYDEDSTNNTTGRLIATKNNTLVLVTNTFRFSTTDTNQFYISKLREIDSSGRTVWLYSSPPKRFIYADKFEPLANGNYLVWGYEETYRYESRHLDSWDRKVLAVYPYLAEINPRIGMVWERKIQFVANATPYALKILKDSSIVITGVSSDSFNNTSAFLIKFRNRYDSLYRRNFRTPTFAASNAGYYPNQIEELNNGDLLIGGYIMHYIPINQPTAGQWGWLVRTDNLGCSLQPNSCRTATKETENRPLSIKVFPNPASSTINVEYDLVDKFENAYISLFDFTGREIKRQKLVANQSQVQWQTDDMQAGLYLISIYADNRLVWKTKVSIQK